MNYQELIERALNGRTVSAAARSWGVPQPTLSRYAKGERMPDWETGLKIAKDAGIDPTEAFEVFAAEERNHKVKNFKLQMGFVQTDLLLFIATGGLSCLFYIMSNGECILVQVKPSPHQHKTAANDQAYFQLSTLKSPRLSLSDIA